VRDLHLVAKTPQNSRGFAPRSRSGTQKGPELTQEASHRAAYTSTVLASTTGMLYVLGEPSVGLHPKQCRRAAKYNCRLGR